MYFHLQTDIITNIKGLDLVINEHYSMNWKRLVTQCFDWCLKPFPTVDLNMLEIVDIEKCLNIVFLSLWKNKTVWTWWLRMTTVISSIRRIKIWIIKNTFCWQVEIKLWMNKIDLKSPNISHIKLYF